MSRSFIFFSGCILLQAIFGSSVENLPELSLCELFDQPCVHGTCVDTSDWYKCTCLPNYTGENCDTKACKDENPYDCNYWAEQGECCKSPEYMGKHCMNACGFCENKDKLNECECIDEDTTCAEMAAEGKCCTNSTYMYRHCKRSCGRCGEESVASDRSPECEDGETWCPLFKQYCDSTSEFFNAMTPCGKTCTEWHSSNLVNLPPPLKKYEDYLDVQMQVDLRTNDPFARITNETD